MIWWDWINDLITTGKVLFIFLTGSLWRNYVLEFTKRDFLLVRVIVYNQGWVIFMVLVCKWPDTSHPCEYSLTPWEDPATWVMASLGQCLRKKIWLLPTVLFIYLYVQKEIYDMIYDNILVTLTPSGWWWFRAGWWERQSSIYIGKG